jgi:hypothetical protein
MDVKTLNNLLTNQLNIDRSGNNAREPQDVASTHLKGEQHEIDRTNEDVPIPVFTQPEQSSKVNPTT